MIENIQLKDFRKFPEFQCRFRKGNILVGPNNTGKSSILDAFRLLEACLRHSRTRNPSPLQIEGRYGVLMGYEVPDTVLPFSLANVTHDYSERDAVIEFRHSNKSTATILLNPDRTTRFFVDAGGAYLATTSKLRSAFPVNLVVVPTLAPLEADEAWVRDETVNRNSATRLASRVLRNIWYRRGNDEFDSFRAEVERAWPSITLKKPELRRSTPPIVEMFYSEDRLDREVQWAGFGFQAWLQLQTHLLRGTSGSILIIDEPDIYLHPDLQRRLLRVIRARFAQFVMATHSVEIVNDADPDEILSINPQMRSARRIHTDGEFANLYQLLGSTDNAEFARIARARRVIFVEGKDGRTLRRLAARCSLRRLADPQGTPIVRLGGFSQWRRAIHAVWAFRSILDLEIDAFCVFDRDYRTEDQVEAFVRTAEEADLQCHVLQQKEIENYLLVPDALHRAILRRIRERSRESAVPAMSDLIGWLDATCDGLKIAVMSQRLANVLQFAKETGSSLDQSTLIGRATSEFELEWRDRSKRLARVPGKEVLGHLNELLQANLKVSVTEAMLDQMFA